MSSKDHILGDPTAIRTDLAAIFISLELSRRTWLVTSLLPGSEKMSRHAIGAGAAGDLLALLGRRRAKSDRIDGESLLRVLLAYKRGEPRVCSMVRPPSPAAEDRRRVSRERKTLVAQRTEQVNRIKGLLFSQGVFPRACSTTNHAAGAGASGWTR